MRARQLATVIAVSGIAACTSGPPPDQQLLAQAEIAIYGVAYREVETDTTSTDTLYISAQFPGFEEVQQTIEDLRPDVGEGLARAYAEANRHAGWHAGPPATRRKNVLVAADSLLPRSMQTHAPVLQFTRPGLNATRDSAVVQAGFQCGGLCGGWQMMLLAKAKNGQWYVVKSFGHAVS